MSSSDYNEVGCSLDCPVCLEPYDKMDRLPKMMSCLHTTCLSCILQMIESQKPETPASASTPNVEPLSSRPRPASLQTPVTGDAGVQALRRRFLNDLTLFYRHSSGSANTIVRLPPPPQPARRVTVSSGSIASPSLRPAEDQGTAQPAKAKEIPKETRLSCPMCRTKINSNSIQTNRYIIAHIDDINKLKKSAEKLNPETQTAPKSAVMPRVTKLGVAAAVAVADSDLVRDSWCLQCTALSDVSKCSSHNRMPLKEWNKFQSKKVNEKAVLMKENVQTQKESTVSLKKELNMLVTTAQTLLSKVESQDRKWDGIKKAFEIVVQNSATNEDGVCLTGATSSGDVCQSRRESALKLLKLSQQLELTQSRAVGIETYSLSGDSVVWSSDNKLYMKINGTTFTVVKENDDYVN